MRITCPNCGAQYEVAEGVIPDGGRDVQCSACAHTWLALPEGIVPEVAEPVPTAVMAEVGPEDGPEVVEEWELEFEPEPEEAEDEVVPEAIEEDQSDEELSDEDLAAEDLAGEGVEETGAEVVGADAGDALDPAPAAQPPLQPPVRPALSPEVAAILREEAEREKAVRAAAGRAPVIETQPDLGLDAHVDPEVQRAEEARRRMARLRGEAAPPTQEPVRPAAEPVRARERLPDIEEINSSLRAASERAPARVAAAAAAAEDRTARGRGFRYGFSLILILAALALVAYTFAAQLGAALPVLQAPLEAYVAQVDEWRLQLDLGLQSLLPPEGGEMIGGDAGASPEAEAPVTEAPMQDAPVLEAPVPDASVTEAPATPGVEE